MSFGWSSNGEYMKQCPIGFLSLCVNKHDIIIHKTDLSSEENNSEDLHLSKDVLQCMPFRGRK